VRQPRPYRPNVGIALFNDAGKVLAGRARSAGPEIVLAGHEWQMPQGGIDRDEDLVEAAKRELFEETNVRSVALLKVSAAAWCYDFPPYDGPPHRLCAFRGQAQSWVAFRFLGIDDEIDVLAPGGGQPSEFSAWDWHRLAELAEQVVPYKRAVYRAVLEAFGDLADRPA
jgi:putative (di)nucleoside polyphosphate hydrolase